MYDVRCSKNKLEPVLERCLTCSYIQLFCLQLNLVEIINDVMYSDSPEVVDAMADFIDRVMESPLEKEISEDRMNQVRHVINVNESAFKANFSAEHLRVIENKEISSILDELSCSVGLQRMRFVELQNQGTLESAARIKTKHSQQYAALFFLDFSF